MGSPAFPRGQAKENTSQAGTGKGQEEVVQLEVALVTHMLYLI